MAGGGVARHFSSFFSRKYFPLTPVTQSAGHVYGQAVHFHDESSTFGSRFGWKRKRARDGRSSGPQPLTLRRLICFRSRAVFVEDPSGTRRFESAAVSLRCANENGAYEALPKP